MGIRRNQSVCYGKVCEAEVCGTDVCEDFVPFMCGNRMRATLISPTCKGVTFVGTEDVSIRQGIGINLLDGVYAYDEDGTELPVTVSPETISKCEVGNHEVVYTAIGAYLSRDKRNVTITQIDPPTISGMDTAHISVNTDFDPANGVSAVDDNGNTVPFEYSGEYYRAASGAIASFETLKQTSAVSVLTTIEPIQDLHGYDKPWSGGNGKNLLDIGSRVNQTTASITYTSDDNYITMNGTKSGGGYANLSNLTISLEAGTYYARAFAISGTTTYNPYIYLFDGTANLNTSSMLGAEREITIDTVKTCTIRVGIFTDGQVFTNFKIGIVISKTSGITSWSPYSNICPISGHTECVTYVSPTTSASGATTYTTDLGRTVYEGTLDVVSGVLTVTHEAVDMGSLSWASYGTGMFYANLTGAKKSTYATPANAYCSCYEIISMSQTATITGVAINDGQSRANAHDTSYTDATAFKTAVTGQTLVYELSTPQTYQLTPQEVELLLGTNNLWTDCGETSVTWEDNIPTSGAYQYPIKGTYQITYTAEDECGNETEVTRTIVVGD